MDFEVIHRRSAAARGCSHGSARTHTHVLRLTPISRHRPLALFYTAQNNEPMMFEHADENPILVLSDDQCWKLIEGTKHGRLVVVVGGEPDIFPVNYA